MTHNKLKAPSFAEEEGADYFAGALKGLICYPTLVCWHPSSFLHRFDQPVYFELRCITGAARAD